MASMSSTDQGQMYTRDMGPHSADSPPQPVEIDLNLSRVLPNPAVSASVPWEFGIPSQGFGNMPYGGSNISRMSANPSEGQSRGPSGDPLSQWYVTNDGPWNPFPKEAIVEDRLLSRHTISRNIPYAGQYRQSNTSDVTSFASGILPSDSGYATRRSIENTSVFSADVQDRDQDVRSMVGPSGDFQIFPVYNEVQQSGRGFPKTWSSPTTQSSEPSGLVCSFCHKPVKTQSEMKKHALRHTKPYLCQVPNCARTEGFSTTNDLDRHTRSKHPSITQENSFTKKFRCHVPGCKSKDKAWPRLDNFRSHLKRVHENYLRSDESFDDMVRRAEFWEKAGIVLDPELTLLQNPPPVNSRPVRPVQDNLPIQGVEQRRKSQYPEIMDLSERSMSPNRPQSVSSENRDLPQKEEFHHPDEPMRTTVQPVEVLKNPTQIPERRMTMGNLLSIGDSDPAQKKTDASMPISGRISPQVKVPLQTVTATDATLTEVIQKALAEAKISDACIKHTHKQNSERSSLPNGKISQQSSLETGSKIVSPNLRDRGLVPSTDVPSEDTPRDLESQKKAQEVLKHIRHLGYTVTKDLTHSPKVQNPGSAASNKSENKVTCKKCQRFTGRPCELRKHMMRHDRPYGCTFPTCKKDFGSKGDWKRHENSQHFHHDAWHCDEKSVEGGQKCSKDFYRLQTFYEHLKKEHQITEIVPSKKKIDVCRIGRSCQTQFWCGFCKELIDLKKQGVEAWNERFNHIDNHFRGRESFPQQNIRDWVPLNSDSCNGDFAFPFPLGYGSRSEGTSPDGTEGSTSGSGSSSESEGQSPDSPIVIKTDAPGTKRPADEEVTSPRPAKQARNPKDFEVRVYCCQCSEPYSFKYFKNCTTCPENHVFGECCHTETVRITDQTPALPGN
ncbi:hypothetical protein VTL71DRAFT_12992 [Oculimacula yallundae]|uniref:C2H2-type domain-containing protein n=1 Tax=Oculimacula yallundae TaxID=86028 RepID=A0ABR4CPQ5_9HELO